MAISAGLAVFFAVMSMPPASAVLSQVDHIVYAAPDLDLGIAQIEALTGVRASQGGQHPGRGTRNALVALGPASYLEIIAPDPSQPEPPRARSFGIDGLKKSRLAAWAAKGTGLEALAREAARRGIDLGQVQSGSRKRPDGVLLRWRTTDASEEIAGGIVPFFIDWGTSPHPSQTAARGATLVGLRAEHPDPQKVERMLRDLGFDLEVAVGPEPALIAVIEGPKGRVELR